MAAEARRAAVALNVTLPVIEGRAEVLDIGLGRFDLMTIGRALHWMDREATLAVFDRILASEGRILICGSTSVAGESNPWRVAYDAVLRSWGAARDGGHRRVNEHWFDGSRFVQIAEIKVARRQITTPEALVERALTRSTSSPAILGSRTEAFRAELLLALAPFFPDSCGPELIEAKAAVFAAA
ncbi:MAG: class I SAM-dependent methyltransferase, partial [Roseiarcus sp.]